MGDGNQKDGIISSCCSLQRIAVGLRYWQTLCGDNKLNQSQVTKDIFVQFCQETYGNFLDDFVHLICCHQAPNDLLKIGDELIKEYGLRACDITKCNKLRRHFQRRGADKNNNNEQDIKYIFYRDCYDRCHHQVFHLFEMGLRSKPESMEEIKNDFDGKDIDFLCVDKVFKKKRDLIRGKRKEYGFDAERYSDSNNKYNLNIKTKKGIQEDDDEGITFLDRVYSVIAQQNENIKYKQIHELNEYLNNN